MSYSDDLYEDEAGPSFWLREAPYLAILALTLGGVAYMSLTRARLFGYWEFMACIVGALCVATGWRDSSDRLRLIWTQALHWGAFLVAMNLLLLPSVQAIANEDITTLAMLLLLALGVFVAGAHLLSWRLCANGLVMALCVPAFAWLDQSALFVSLMFIVVVVGALAFFWLRRERGARGV